MVFHTLLLIATLAIGIILLVKGADWLVSGGSAIAKIFGVSDLAIGLTIVAFGTSMPELVVNIIASTQGNTDIAIGNVVGSNIANILLILGVAGIISPIAVQRSTVRKEIPFSLLAAVMLFVMANDTLMDGSVSSILSRSDGIALAGFFLIFLYYSFGIRRQETEVLTEGNRSQSSTLLSCGWILLGLLCLTGGGKLAVDAAKALALQLGVSEALVGLTIIAVGTSLPELATSAVAAYRGKADIAVGNIVGSNIFNIFWVLGLSAIIKPLPFQPALNVDLGMVILSTLLLFFIIHNGSPHRRLLLWWKQSTDYVIRRWEGAVLLATYIAYIAYIAIRG